MHFQYSQVDISQGLMSPYEPAQSQTSLPPPVPPKTRVKKTKAAKPIETINVENVPLHSADHAPAKHAMDPHRPDRWQRMWDRLGSWWMWEVVCIVIGTACLLAIIVICRYLENQPLDSWHSSISPNAMISTLTTISKATVLFAVAASISQLKWLYFQNRPRRLADIDVYNEATSSPVGAFQFLFKMKGHALLASTAALIVIIALAFEPMAQQLLSYEPESIADTTRQASIPMAQVYDLGGSFPPRSASSQGDLSAVEGFAVDDRMRIAVLDGFFGSSNGSTPASMQLPLSCPSGNCTFDPFTTLGVCSSCRSAIAGADGVFRNASWINRVHTLINDNSANFGSNYGDSEELVIFTDSGLGVRLYTKAPPGFQGNALVAMNVTGAWIMDLASIMPPGTKSNLTDGPTWGSQIPSSLILKFLVARADPSALKSYSGKPLTPNITVNPIIMKDLTECDLRWCAQEYGRIEIAGGSSTSQQPKRVWPLTYVHDPNYQHSTNMLGEGYYQNGYISSSMVGTMSNLMGFLTIPNNTGSSYWPH